MATAYQILVYYFTAHEHYFVLCIPKILPPNLDIVRRTYHFYLHIGGRKIYIKSFLFHVIGTLNQNE